MFKGKDKYNIAMAADKRKNKLKALEYELSNMKSTGKAFILVDSPMSCYKLFRAIKYVRVM